MNLNILEKPVLAGTIVVAKVGGNVVENKVLLSKLIADIAILTKSGLSLALVHGGGTAIDKKLQESGTVPSKINGLRVTDKKTLGVVVEVLSEINQSIVGKLAAAGVLSAGFLPGSQQIFQGEKLQLKGPSGEILDLGYTGKIINSHTAGINEAFLNGYVPVVAPIASDKDGNLYNINADHAALALASALNADKLISITDVPGLLADPQKPCSIIKHINLSEAKEIVESGTLHGGMLPKLQSCVEALEAGVASVQIIDGSEEHGLLKALTALDSIGTIISKTKYAPGSTG